MPELLETARMEGAKEGRRFYFFHIIKYKYLLNQYKYK